VAAAVAGEIGGRLGGARLQVAVPRPVDPKAYELYLNLAALRVPPYELTCDARCSTYDA
jgi:hypothetical protein